MNAFEVALGVLMALCILILVMFWDSKEWDSTDDRANDKRSSMVIYTDYGTGCEYLTTIFGGLTPRLDANGDQLGCEK